jgi:chemotaxis protein CheD
VTGLTIAAPPARGPRLVAVTGERVYLHPGQLAVADTDCTLTTVLGSCVAVCLHDPVRGAGGLNHFLLPEAPAADPSTRYGDVATRRLLQELERLGSRRADLTAFVAGGACVLDAYQARKAQLGGANVRAALAILQAAGIRVTGQDVEGSRGRRVTFRIQDGAVTVKTL